jgi:antitoxin (DNA-binding transcriptional repressor) of toxin-antitoxin stability system
MSNVTLQEAQTGLADLIHGLRPGEVVLITENARPVAQLTPAPGVAAHQVPRPRPPVTGTPQAGRLKHVLVVPDDFDQPLEELREYME